MVRWCGDNLLVAELSHRVKNLLATVMSISKQTFKMGQDFEKSQADLEGRLLALSKTHTRLSESEWRGARIDDILHDDITWVAESDSASLSFFRSAGWDPDRTVRTLDTGEKSVREIRLAGTLTFHLKD
jgi:two-component sensor histidine kinase